MYIVEFHKVLENEVKNIILCLRNIRLSVSLYLTDVQIKAVTNYLPRKTFNVTQQSVNLVL